MKYYIPPKMTGFESLQAWLKDMPDQTMGDPCAVCQTGELYIEFSEVALSRPDDISTIEELVARRMSQRLADYFGGKSGRIYWRTPLETKVEPNGQIVLRYDVNGPDKCFLTDRSCYLDKNWMTVSAYCRMYRATMQTMMLADDRVEKKVAA